jgi:hypothetical protein
MSEFVYDSDGFEVRFELSEKLKPYCSPLQNLESKLADVIKRMN